jgi:hypothetical protein
MARDTLVCDAVHTPASRGSAGWPPLVESTWRKNERSHTTPGRT